MHYTSQECGCVLHPKNNIPQIKSTLNITIILTCRSHLDYLALTHRLYLHLSSRQQLSIISVRFYPKPCQSRTNEPPTPVESLFLFSPIPMHQASSKWDACQYGSTSRCGGWVGQRLGGMLGGTSANAGVALAQHCLFQGIHHRFHT